MRVRRFDAEPKPFALIPIPEEPPRREKPCTHRSFHGLTGQLELSFTVVSKYLFVGSGEYEFDPNAKGDRPDVWHTFYRCNGRICIPGSSIKGAIRSILEAISNSCVLHSRPHEVRLTNIGQAHRPCKSTDNLCPACRIFGHTGLQGRASFSDAFPENFLDLHIVKIPELWHHRPKKVRRLDKARRFYENRKFKELSDKKPEPGHWFVEAVCEGARFRTSLHFENLSESEFGLLLYSLGWKEEAKAIGVAFTPKLGGAKPRCFGTIKFEPVRLLLWDTWLKSHAIQDDEMIAVLVKAMRKCRQSELLHRESWETSIQKLQPREESCPGGNY